MTYVSSTKANNEKEELLDMDRAHLWHHMSPHNDHPHVFIEGKASWIKDIDGNEYLDGMSGLWCVNIGHGREEVARVAAAQMSKLAFAPLSQSHVPAIELSGKLNEWLQGDYKIFFSNSGSDANEVAFKIARQYFAQTGKGTKYKFISRYRAYHGNSMGAMGATGQAERKVKYEPGGEGFKHAAPPYCYRCPFGQEKGHCKMECAKAIDEMIEWEGEETVAGVILEPVITGGGVIVPPPEYLKEIREICDRRNVLLIVDEVICGFGRSGEKFGHQNFGVEPDIVSMAKGMTSAYAPLSATAVSSHLYAPFKEKGKTNHFRHVNTFGGNPVSCAIALKNLEILEREQLIKQAKDKGKYLTERLAALTELSLVGDVRTFGLTAGIELVEDKKTKVPASLEKVANVLAMCKKHNILIGKNGDTVPHHNNVITVAPPFVTTKEELDLIVETLYVSINNSSK